MGIESVSDALIEELLHLNKRVENPKARPVDKGPHVQTTYRVASYNPDYSFSLYTRQNHQYDRDFSCGLIWNMPSGESIHLVRYNGSSHKHHNKLEKISLERACHIHRATERYILENLNPDGYAEITKNYSTVSGALHQLVTDCNISGIPTEPDYPDLFSEH